MKNSFFTLILLFQCIFYAQAQIVNIEDKRASLNDTIGWYERLDLGYNLINNGQKISTLSASLQIEFVYKEKSFLSLSKYNFLKAGDQSFVNEGFQHLRYTSRINKTFAFEGFGQVQYNEKTKTKLRMLLGTGVRINLLTKDHLKFSYGLSAMYEYEEVKDETSIHQDTRVNNYISFKWKINKTSHFYNTTYFQPLIDNIHDFRLSSESTLVFKLSKHLSFTSSFSITNDSRPAEDVVGTIYSFKNGIRWQFK